jgi:hypothetical protein
LAATLPIRLTGRSSNAYFGRSVAYAGDIDKDSVADFLIAEPGTRCQGALSGVISIYSVAAQQLVHSACPFVDFSETQYGTPLMVGPQSGYLYFGLNIPSSYGDSQYLRSLPIDYLSEAIPTTNSSDKTYITGLSAISPIIAFGDDNGSYIDTYDNLIIGKPEDDTNEGRVHVMKSSWGTIEFKCSYDLEESSLTNAYFGTSNSFVDDADGDTIRDLLVGAPGYPLDGAKGSVFILPGINHAQGCNGTSTWPASDNDSTEVTVSSPSTNIILRIDANDATINTLLSRPAYIGFGNYVMSLPDLDGAGGADAYVYIANTRMLEDTNSEAIPEYFIFSYTNSDNSLDLIHHGEDRAGTMLGGNIAVVSDIDGDGIKELAVSCAGCQGRLGNTGHVKILSGGKVVSDPQNAIIQMLYNPDPDPSHFGVSVDYNDITGDGIRDFLVGADRFSTGDLTNAGALYIYQIEAIRE